MSVETEKLLAMIKQNKSADEICKMLRINHKQLFMKLSMLKNAGYLVKPAYDTKGRTFYGLKSPFEQSEVKVSQYGTKQNIRAVLISDLHLGNKLDNIEYINAVYDYCVKNDIHIILNAGDLFEGIYPDKKDASITDPKEQISYVLQSYPFDHNILNFIVLGNHDASFWYNEGIDIKTILENRRGDIVPIGYGNGIINISNCDISMFHKIEKANVDYCDEAPIVVKGHSHKYKILVAKNGNINVSVPTLSNVSTGNEPDSLMIPGIIDMRLEKNDSCIHTEYFQHLVYVDGSFRRVGETQLFNQLPLQTDKSLIRKK